MDFFLAEKTEKQKTKKTNARVFGTWCFLSLFFFRGCVVCQLDFHRGM